MLQQNGSRNISFFCQYRFYTIIMLAKNTNPSASLSIAAATKGIKRERQANGSVCAEVIYAFSDIVQVLTIFSLHIKLILVLINLKIKQKCRKTPSY